MGMHDSFMELLHKLVWGVTPVAIEAPLMPEAGCGN
jgi:hypothetical protein